MSGTVYIDPMKVERDLFDGMDRVDKRDKQNRIVSMVANRKFTKHYDEINWIDIDKTK